MTYNDGVKIASRVAALYLIFWVISDAIDLPQEVMSLRHTLPDSIYPQGGYFIRQALMLVARTVLKIALWLMAAIWFYKCGPGIQKFFGCDVQEEITQPENGQ